MRPKVVLVGLFPPLSIAMAQRFDRWVAQGRSERFDIRRLKGRADRSLVGRIKNGLGNSYAALGLWHGLKAALDRSDLHTMTFDDGRVRLVSTRYGDTAVAVRTQRPDFMRVVEILDRLAAEVRADGAELVVLPFPTKEEIHLPLLGERPHVLTEPFEHALGERGIRSLDLERPLAAGVEMGRDLFFEIDLHPNPTGQRVVARTVVGELRRHFGERALEARRVPSQAAARAGAAGIRASAASITSGPAPR